MKTQFKYEYEINDHLALGYGSKYHLLRMLGWHRKQFNKLLSAKLHINNNIDWLDFGFKNNIDLELSNFGFISKSIDKEWRNYWVCGPKGISWDAVGRSQDGTYVLVEAKANENETYNDAKGCSKSVAKNTLRFKELTKKYNLDIDVENWNKDTYQLANRLVVIDFLEQHGIKAKFVYLLFANGFENNTPENQSVSKEEWVSITNNKFKKMCILGTKLEKKINVVYIDAKNLNKI